jgi:hypothetical protein
MPLLKKEHLDLIDNDEVRNVLIAADAEYEKAMGSQKQLTEAITKIYSNPKTKEAFQMINKEAGLGLDLPPSPIDAYVEPVKKELADLRKERAEEAKLKEKQSCLEKMRELSIANTPENIKAIGDFQTVHGITNALSAIELWAKQREPEPSAIEYSGNPFKFDGIPDEDKARQNAFKEIQDFKSQLRR